MVKIIHEGNLLRKVAEDVACSESANIYYKYKRNEMATKG